MQVWTVTDLNTEPVALLDMKNYLRVNASNDDVLITSMIKSARMLCENYTNQAFGSKTLKCRFDVIDLYNMTAELPYWPHGVITSVVRYDTDGSAETLNLNDGYMVYGNLRKEMNFASATTTFWHDQNTQYVYEVTYTAGYGISSSGSDDGTPNFPEPFKMAIMKQVSEWYDNREDFTPVMSSSIRRILDGMSSEPPI
jgi:uncharacterized phiE125 gp8 family phage protein